MQDKQLARRPFKGKFWYENSKIEKSGTFWINQMNELICSPDGLVNKTTSISFIDPWRPTPQLSLTVFDTLGDSNSKIIQGDIDGKKISLFDTSIATQFVVNDKSKKSYFPFTKPFTTFYVSYAIISDFLVSNIPDKFKYMEFTFNNSNTFISFLLKEKIQQQDSEKIAYNIILEDFELSYVYKKSKSPRILITAKQPNTINWFLERIDQVRNYHVCITGQPTYISDVILPINDKDCYFLSEFDRNYNYNYYGAYWELNWQSVLNFKVLSNSLRKWFSNKMYEEIYMLNYKDTINCFIQPNMHYLLLISALEAYHKKTINPNEVNLKNRLVEIIERNNIILPKLTKFIKDEIDFYVNTRNFIGHANLFSSKPIFDLTSNPYKITKLQKLMQLLLLKDLGYSDDVLLLLFLNTLSYKDLM